MIKPTPEEFFEQAGATVEYFRPKGSRRSRRGAGSSVMPNGSKAQESARAEEPDGGEEHTGDWTMDGPLELHPAKPRPSARLFVKHHCMANGLRILHHHADVFYMWNGRCYESTDQQTIRSMVAGFLADAKEVKKGGLLVPFQPNITRVSNVIDALAAICNLPSNIRSPAWLPGAADVPPASEIIACANGLLHLPTRTLLPPTPAFFSLNALDFAFDPDAAPPTRWLQFLTELWADDHEAMDTLQECFGYFLTPDTRQQKIVLLTGPKRSGKGTIARVVKNLLGPSNVCNPTLASLAQNFGLMPFIGRQLAIFGDARIGNRPDQHVIVERLLSISGEDSLTIDRKYLAPWTGTLSTRIMITTNELPKLADASGALASRFIVLTLIRNFYGREELDLTRRLLDELPAILNWSIEGWDRLQDRGYFLQPASSAAAIRSFEDLSSPIGAFLRERCKVGAGGTVSCRLLFAHWRVWCEDQNRSHPGTVQSFGRDLRAAIPNLGDNRPRSSDDRERHYEGLTLLPDIPITVRVRAEALAEANR